MMDRKAPSNIRDVIIESILRSSTNIAIAATDLAFRILYYNPAAENIFGYHAEEVIGKTVMEVHSRESIDPSRFKKAIEAVKENGEYCYEVKQKVRGETRFISSRVSGIRDRQKNLIGFVLTAQDMTDQKKTQERLLESEIAWKRMFNSISDFVSIHDSECRLLKANKSLADHLGVPPESLEGEKCYKIYRTGEQKELCDNCYIGEAAGLKRPITREMDVSNLGCPLEMTISPSFNDRGDVVETVVIARDITERRMQEEALRESEKRYRTLVENSTHCIHEMDLKGRMLSMNKAGLRMMNKTDDKDIIGVDYLSFVSEQDKVRIGNLLAEAFSGDLSEFEFASSGRTSRIFKSSFIPIKTPDGSVIKIMGITEDVTEQRQTMEALRESELLYRSILESISDAVYITDDSGSFTMICSNVDIIFGYGKDELLSLGGIDRLFGEHTIDLPALQITDEIRNMEISISDKRGNIKDLLVNIKRVAIGRGTYLFACRDITERKKAEKALKYSEAKLKEQKEALEQKNIALKEMIEQINIEKNKIREDIAANVENTLLPLISRLRLDDVQQGFKGLLERHLLELASSFGKNIARKAYRLTSKEIEICTMIKGGLSSKEIAGILNISPQTVERHRKNIRRKLELSNRKIPLASFLQTI